MAQPLPKSPVALEQLLKNCAQAMDYWKRSCLKVEAISAPPSEGRSRSWSNSRLSPNGSAIKVTTSNGVGSLRNLSCYGWRSRDERRYRRSACHRVTPLMFLRPVIVSGLATITR
jgi:hypothetical protein